MREKATATTNLEFFHRHKQDKLSSSLHHDRIPEHLIAVRSKDWKTISPHSRMHDTLQVREVVQVQQKDHQ